MVGIAWLGLVGSWILSWVAGKYIGLRLTFDIQNATSVDGFVERVRPLLTAAVVIDVVTGVLIAIGAVVLIMLMVRIERRSRTRTPRCAVGRRVLGPATTRNGSHAVDPVDCAGSATLGPPLVAEDRRTSTS